MKGIGILAVIALTYASSTLGQITPGNPIAMPKTIGQPCPGETDLYACVNDDFLICDAASSTWILQNKCAQICSYDVAFSQFCTFFSPSPMSVPGMAGNVVGVSAPPQGMRAPVAAAVAPAVAPAAPAPAAPAGAVAAPARPVAAAAVPAPAPAVPQIPSVATFAPPRGPGSAVASRPAAAVPAAAPQA